MSHLRMLLASALAAGVLTFLGPLFLGVAPAFAAGPQVHTNQQWSGWNHRNDGDHDRDDFCRRDPDDCRPHRSYNNFNCYCAQPYPYQCYCAQPVYYVQPVYSCYCAQPVYAQPTYNYAPSYYWMNYGPNWNYGMPYYQVQSVCGQYNQAMAGNWYGYGYNQYVASVCISIQVGGNQVTVTVSP